MADVCIIEGARTPRGRGRATGALHDSHPQNLMAGVLEALWERVGFEREDVDDVVLGNASNDGDHSSNIARLSVLAAGWPVSIPGVTVNRYCGSGLQAISFGAMGIAAGWQQLVVSGGVESMSRFVTNSGIATLDGGNPTLRERHPTIPQGVSADLIATIEGFGRTELDAFAVRSQLNAARAVDEGRFDRSLVPVRGSDGSVLLNRDEHPRPGTTVETLAKLNPAFIELGGVLHPGYDRTFDQMAMERYPQVSAIEHLHHAGNSSGVVDGAGAVLLASGEYAQAHGLVSRGRIVGSAAVGGEPIIMLTEPGPAALRCLKSAGMSVGDIDLWEINEAFAAVDRLMRDHDPTLQHHLFDLAEGQREPIVEPHAVADDLRREAEPGVGRRVGRNKRAAHTSRARGVCFSSSHQA